MSILTVRELSHNTSAVLERVERGETVEITRFGKVIAVIHPAGLHRRTRDALIAAGVLAGRGEPGGARRRLGPPLPSRPDRRPLSEALAELRDEEGA